MLAKNLLWAVVVLLDSLSLSAGMARAADPPVAANAPTVDDNTPEANVVKGMLVKAVGGSPIAGARVILLGDVAKTATSDAHGRFRFANVAAFGRGYEIWASAGNLVAQKATIVELPASGGATRYVPLRLSMAEGSKVKFVVTSKATGKPIAGARIWLPWPDHRKLITGADGAALASGLLPDTYEVELFQDGYARTKATVSVAHAAATEVCAVAMSQGGIVRGTVVEESGKPMRGVSVYYRSDSIDGGWWGDRELTDKNGKFQDRFAPFNLPIEVGLSKSKYAVQSATVTLSAAQPKRDLRFVLKRLPIGGALAGIVTDLSDRPIADARVANYGTEWNPNCAANTDAHGRFHLEDLRKGFDGTVSIAVAAKGFAPKMVAVKLGTTEHPGEIVVKLEPGHKIHGRIFNADGKPAPHVVISVQSQEYPWNRETSPAEHTTNANGEFAIDSLPADARFSLWTQDGIGMNDTHWKLDSPIAIVYKLASPALIRGIVVDAETGKPLKNFHIRLDYSTIRQPGDPAEFNSFDAKWIRTGGDFHTSDGRFTIQPLGDRNPFELIVDAEGYDRNIDPRVVARTPEEATDLRMVLERITPADLSAIHGQFLDHDGRPIAGVQLRLIVSSRLQDFPIDMEMNWQTIESGEIARKSFCDQFVSLTTDGEGRFEFSKILPGRYVQLAYWGASVPKHRWIAAEKSQSGKDIRTTMRVPEPATVRGTIDRAKFADATLIRLQSIDDETLSYSVYLNADQSKFEFSALSPGRYSLQVWGKPTAIVYKGMRGMTTPTLATRVVEIAAGNTKDIHFAEPDKRPPD